ncbi:MAG TPA: DinB family protein [Methylomirabilota bacterium]|nr:DinB family protein [Methylomirabilota bacterium]
MPPRPLEPAAVAALLQSAATTIHAELAALPASVLEFHPADGEWCAKEVLGHLIECEKRGFSGRIHIILRSDHAPSFEGWDQEAVARARKDCARDWPALYHDFLQLRSASVAQVAALSPADLARGGQHPKVGLLTVADLLHEWVFHDRNHIRQMLANVQAFAWPNMGNAQRFSLP